MNHNTTLKSLFDRYFSGFSSPEENAELARLIEKADATTLTELLSRSWENLQETDPVISSEQTDLMLKAILGEVSREGGSEETVDGVENSVLPAEVPIDIYTERQKSSIYSLAKNNRWWKYSAAAAILLLLVSTAYVYMRDKPSIQPEELVQAFVNDIPPGHQGAVLTLANGEKISLETAGEGLVTKQGQTEVVNNEGRLSYQSQSGLEGPMMYNTMSTPKGRQYQLVLSDGTKVWLNAASSITYPISFSGNDRAISISGEAYFEVAPDKKRPFRVNINNKGEVEVLGTHFNINAYTDEPAVKATLLEGSVKVHSFSGQQSSVLKPGQQAQIGTELQILDDVNIEEVVAWKNGYFSFNGATIETIMRQVTRWYDAEIVYEGNVKDEQFTGSIPRSAAASKLLEVLELTRTVKFKIEEKKITVKPY